MEAFGHKVTLIWTVGSPRFCPRSVPLSSLLSFAPHGAPEPPGSTITGQAKCRDWRGPRRNDGEGRSHAGARGHPLAAGIAVRVWVAIRRGRRDARTQEAIRRANARITALKTARDIHHDLQDADRDDLQRRADRWMRDRANQTVRRV